MSFFGMNRNTRLLALGSGCLVAIGFNRFWMADDSISTETVAAMAARAATAATTVSDAGRVPGALVGPAPEKINVPEARIASLTLPAGFTPPSEEERLATFNQLSPRYDALVQGSEKVSMLRADREYIASRAHGHVLEVACGTGRNGEYIKPGQIRSFTAVDFSAGMVAAAQAKARAPENRDRLCPEVAHGRYLVASAHALPFADGVFQSVMATFALCSIEHPHAALLEMRRVLEPEGGVLLLMDHGASTFRPMQWILDYMLPGQLKRHGCYHNRNVSTMVTAAGFRITEIQRRHFGTSVRIIATPDPDFVPPPPAVATSAEAEAEAAASPATEAAAAAGSDLVTAPAS
ncbi:hypothetical protein H696_06224 [Fonticula alba]|uniref:Methyltransferase type 11 domain-containing protein n=1 Tax=Fonticula alba TaxID=691883 RepID=A0A058YZQ2_FONAL|nr:hypothetical protein H696_06224 [Fonticula alba]KCV67356.1 hypothetical protein H696_06224 [Fonticula alba]|eukprot:XP_009498245.1 hypothetical protein H696_06224 [Fonticula alba]